MCVFGARAQIPGTQWLFFFCTTLLILKCQLFSQPVQKLSSFGLGTTHTHINTAFLNLKVYLGAWNVCNTNRNKIITKNKKSQQVKMISSLMLVVSGVSLLLDNSLSTSFRHVFWGVLHSISLRLLQICWSPDMDSGLQCDPHIFCWIHVWALCRPVQDVHFAHLEVVIHQKWGMLCVTIMLEDKCWPKASFVADCLRLSSKIFP